MKPVIVTSTLVILAFFAGMSASLFLIPFWVIPFQAAVEKSTNPADWIGFGGNFAAGIMTLVSAVIAWVAIQRQIQVQEKAIQDAELHRQSERAERHIGAKNSAIVALRDPVEAGAGLYFCIQQAQAASTPGDINEWDENLKQITAILGRALQHFSLAAVASDMAWEDRRKYVAVLTDLSTLEIFVSKPPSTMSRADFLEHVMKEYSSMLAHITEFDGDLGNTFEKQATS